MKVNLPFEGMRPLNSREDGAVLEHARELVRIAMDAAGHKEVGCGFGVRIADVGVEMNGRRVEIEIRLRDDEE